MDETNINKYAKDYAEEIDKPDNFESWLLKARLEIIKEAIKKYKPKSILEIGPGLNPICYYLKGYDRYSLIEPSKEFYNRIKEVITNSDIDIPEILMSNKFLEEADIKYKYDMIIISSVLHEIRDINVFLKCVYNLCGKNTLVHINVPNCGSLHRLLGVEMGLIKDLSEHSEIGEKFQRQTEFDLYDLILLVSNHKFRVLDYSSYLLKPFPNDMMSKIITKDIFEGLMKIIQNSKLFKYKYMGAEIYVNVMKE